MSRATTRLGATVGAGAAVAAGCFAYGCLIEQNDFVLRRYELPLLPVGSRRVRILHISDIHLMPYNHARRRWIAGLAALEPDLVVNTGDNHASETADAPLLDALGRLLDVPGVFVFGSNDYTGPAFKNPLSYLTGRRKNLVTRDLPWRELKAGFEARGWVDLTHQREVLRINDVALELRGVDDAHLGRDDYAAVAGPPAAEVALGIGVMHAPYTRTLDAMTRDGVGLMLAGHTHGGQVCVPGYGALVTNCDIDRRYVQGLHEWNVDGRKSWLEVSAGLGNSPYAPYRFACRPEATLLTLRAPDDPAAAE